MMELKYENVKDALSQIPSPNLFLDLNAFEENIKWAVKEAKGKKIRLSTKSIRSIDLLKKIFSYSSVFDGVMSFTLSEALWLRENGIKNILVGFPTTDLISLDELAKQPGDIVLMTDHIEHLKMLETFATKYQTQISICIDFDLALDLPAVKFGVYRSSLNNIDKIKNFNTFLKENCPHLKLVSTMGYEAQIAAVQDKKSPLMRSLKMYSIPDLRKRRREFIQFLIKEGHHFSFHNGGGTGSLKSTREENLVTEITVGSAFYAPTLFDGYQDFKLTPALFFTIPIVRKSTNYIFTCLGGGYVASGETSENKLPTPYLPEGLSFIKHEGAGEVQTPLIYNGKGHFNIGDFVIFRHAKAGEICERFNEIHLVKDNQYLGSVPTYRGMGKAFL